eukprot:2340707-Rhodomonas_salina.1
MPRYAISEPDIAQADTIYQAYAITVPDIAIPWRTAVQREGMGRREPADAACGRRARRAAS